MIEILLIFGGIVLGLAGELGLMFGFCFAFIVAVLAAQASPSRDLLEGVPLGLWLLLPLAGAYCIKRLWSRREASHRS